MCVSYPMKVEGRIVERIAGSHRSRRNDATLEFCLLFDDTPEG